MDLDEIIDDVLSRMEYLERRKGWVLTKCQHCKRKMRAEQGATVLCQGCVIKPGHSAEERFLRAIMDQPNPCERCSK